MGLFSWIARVFGSGNVSPVHKILPTSAEFDYPIVYVPGPPQHNALRNRSENDAALAIDQLEYNNMLNSFMNDKSIPKNLRKQMGEKLVEKNPKWVPGEDREPKRNLSPSSSAIRSLRITPDNKIAIKYGNNPTEYTYRGGNSVQEAAQAVLELINSNSIGREVNTKIPGSWGARHYDAGHA